MNREVVFYKTQNEKCPAKEFLDSLPSKAAQKVSLLEDLEVIPIQYFSKMPGTGEIWECRAKLGSNIYRIFAFWDEEKIILAHGLIKKTQKTPKNEIERAETYRKEYIERKGRKLS